MNTFCTFTSLAFFLLTIYILARADGWSRLKAVLITAAVVVIPGALVFSVFVFPAPTIVVETVSGVGPVGAMVVLFALAKSVANKVDRSQGN